MAKAEGGLNVLTFVRLGDLSFKLRAWLQSQVSSPAIYELSKLGNLLCLHFLIFAVYLPQRVMTIVLVFKNHLVPSTRQYCLLSVVY